MKEKNKTEIKELADKIQEKLDDLSAGTLTPGEMKSIEISHEKGRNLKIGDIVKVSGVISVPNGSIGKVVDMKHSGEDVPGPSVEITKGPFKGRVTGPLFNSEYELVEKEVKSENDLVN